jgi:hypothetical protein
MAGSLALKAMEKAKSEIPKAAEPNGWDDGVLPRFLVMANLALPELWYAAKCDALGFFVRPNVGEEREVPTSASAWSRCWLASA